MMLGQNESPEQLALVQKKYGFDLPVSKQYLLYLNDLSPLSLHSTDRNALSYFSTEKIQCTSNNSKQSIYFDPQMALSEDFLSKKR
jgi:peptide/nickel transport system permease protein